MRRSPGHSEHWNSPSSGNEHRAPRGALQKISSPISATAGHGGVYDTEVELHIWETLRSATMSFSVSCSRRTTGENCKRGSWERFGHVHSWQVYIPFEDLNHRRTTAKANFTFIANVPICNH